MFDQKQGAASILKLCWSGEPWGSEEAMVCSTVWLRSQLWAWIIKFDFDPTLFKTKYDTDPAGARVWFPMKFGGKYFDSEFVLLILPS